MRTILYLTLLVLAAYYAAPATSAEPRVRTYQAGMNESYWRSEAGERACHLIHRIPGYGTALFTTSLRDTLALTVFTRRPPERGGTATVIARPPRWRDGPDREIGQASVYPDRAVLKFGHGMTARVLAELERGQEVAFRFDSYFDDSAVEIVLQPVKFGPAHQAHLRCLPRVRTAASADGGVGPAGATGEAAATGTAAGGGADTPTNARSLGTALNASSGAAGLRRMNATGASKPVREADGRGSDARRGAAGGSAQRAQTDGVGTARAAAARPVPEGIPVPPAATIHFVHDSAGLDREDLDKIDRLARQVAGNPHWSAVLIVGHTDSRGESHYNRTLGLSRARAVRERLIQEGVEPGKIRIQTAGETNPVGSNDKVYGRAKNRRVAVQPVL